MSRPSAKLSMEELLKFFEENGEGSGLVSDDAGHWAVSSSGMQVVPENPPQDILTTFFIGKEEWRPTIREALEDFREAVLD